MVDKSMFWDINRTTTHNSLFYIIVGNRGGGKSYGAKKKAIENFIRRKEQFGYIRRYRDDLKKPIEQFFKDVAYEFPDYEFKVNGDKLYIRVKPEDSKQKWTDDDIAGYGFVLSTANNKKSMSFPRITMLIFDEFLLEEGNQRYLTGEVNKLLNLYETVARPGTDHPRCTLWMLANAITITNPYFLAWKLRMPTTMDKNGKWIWKHPTKPILVEDVRNEKFIEAKKATEFGAIIAGTEYAEFSIENKFLLDDDTFVQPKSPKARHLFNFDYKGVVLGVWYDGVERKMYVTKFSDPYAMTYAMTLDDHRPNTVLLRNKGRNYHFNMMIEAFKGGMVYFDSINTKNISYEVLNMLLY